MLINKITYNPNFNYPKINFCGRFFRHKPLDKDVFEKNTNINLNQTNNTNVPFGVDQELKTKTDINLDNLPQVSGRTTDIAHDTVKVAKLMKVMLDSTYGKGNYTFVSIGTSPAGVGKALELMGEDVRYLPISSLAYMDKSDVVKYGDIEKHPEYKNFLHSIGISKKEINKGKKDFVFCDYTFSGKTLKILENMARKAGLREDKAHFISMNDSLLEFFQNERQRKPLNEYFEEYCLSQVMEDYAGIPHVDYNETKNIDSIIKNRKKSKLDKKFELLLQYFINNDEI